jgi:hypothetical protein
LAAAFSYLTFSLIKAKTHSNCKPMVLKFTQE